MHGLRGPPLLLERADVLDERPAVVLGQMPPRRHGAAPGGYLPEDLAVALVLNLLGSPVGRLGIQSDRRGAVALATVAMAGDAVDLGDLLALVHHFRARRYRTLLALLRIGGIPRRLSPHRASESQPEGHRDHHRTADERSHHCPSFTASIGLRARGTYDPGHRRSVVRQAPGKIPGVEEVAVVGTFDPPWTPDRITHS